VVSTGLRKNGSGSSIDRASFSELYPFEEHYFETPAGRLHYVDEGPRDAPVLLMLHGNPTWSFYYRNLILAFRERFRVIAPDHMGCGLSDKPQDFNYTLKNHIDNVEALVGSLGLERFTLVLHDWGGAIGMGLGVRFPERVERLVVFNTAAFTSERMPWLLSLSRVPGFGALSIRGLNAFSRVALSLAVHHRDRLTKEIRAGYVAPYNSWKNRIATLRFVQDIPMAPSHQAHAVVEEIDSKLGTLRDRPMLIVWGAKDFVFDDHFLEGWRQRFPDAEVHYLEDASHYVVEDAHERIIPWMERFLEAN
jgi:haloalkane dehalogenase